MTMVVNVNTLHYISPINFMTKDNENKIKIRQAVVRLVEKKCLLPIDKELDEENTHKIKNSTYFTAIINEEIEDKFVPLHFNEFRFFKAPVELFIYAIAKKFSNSTAEVQGFKGSYSRWAKLLNLSDKTSIKKLEEAKERNLISIEYGKYVSQNKQSVNIYTYNDLMKK